MPYCRCARLILLVARYDYWAVRKLQASLFKTTCQLMIGQGDPFRRLARTIKAVLVTKVDWLGSLIAPQNEGNGLGGRKEH